MSKDKIRSSQIDASSFVEKRRLNTYSTSIFENAIIALIVRPVFIIVFIAFLIISPFLLIFTNNSGILFFCLPVFYIFMFKSRKLPSNSTLPGKKPSHIFKKDKASDVGELIFGEEVGTNLNMYQSSADTLRHTLIIGSSGSGKTVFIYCVYIYNYLSLNSGFWMQDYKGATDVSLAIQSILSVFGRSNCYRGMNYNGRQQLGSIQKQSNSNNPMLTSDFEKSLMFLFGFIPEGTGDNKFFVDGAYEILRTALPILHHLQDKKLLNITASTIRKYTAPRALQMLYFNDDIPQALKEKYLIPFYENRGIPYDSEKSKIPTKLMEQYSSFVGNFSTAIQLIGTSFSQIHESIVNEFDPVDIFKNRRCAVTLVPVSGLSEADLSALCTANANLVKFTFDAYLDGSAVGNAEDIAGITRGPDDTPMALIVDELGMGLKTDIYGLTVAQGRGFGIAFIGGTQDADKPVSVNQGQWSQIEGSAYSKFILNAENTTENSKMFERWIIKKTVMRKSVASENLNNNLTNIESKVEEDFVLDLSKIPTFAKGEFYFKQEGTYTHGRIYYNDPNEFQLPQFRQVTKMKVIRYNQHSLAEDILASNVMFNLNTILDSAKGKLKKLIGESNQSKLLFNALVSSDVSIGLKNKYLELEYSASDTLIDSTNASYIATQTVFIQDDIKQNSILDVVDTEKDEELLLSSKENTNIFLDNETEKNEESLLLNPKDNSNIFLDNGAEEEKDTLAIKPDDSEDSKDKSGEISSSTILYDKSSTQLSESERGNIGNVLEKLNDILSPTPFVESIAKHKLMMDTFSENGLRSNSSLRPPKASTDDWDENLTLNRIDVDTLQEILSKLNNSYW